MKSLLKQRGFSLVYFLILLGVASGALLMYLKPTAQNLKFGYQQKQLDTLKEAKENLLLYTISIPELYSTNDSQAFFDASRVSGPGYLPTPISIPFTTNYVTCSDTTPFALGYLPPAIGNRHFTFSGSSMRIHYVMDCRFAIQNTSHNNGTIKRFSPLNNESPDFSDPNTDPLIQLGNQSNIVAFIFIDPENTAADYRLNPADLTSNQFNRPKLVATISHADWVRAVCTRVSAQRTRLSTINPSAGHWFNSYDSANNPVGANWRNLSCN
jgi:hypothetical protein